MSNTLQLQITANNTALAELSKTKAAVVELSSTAQQQIGGLQGLGGALQRMERREPSMAMRSIKTSIEEMALSATSSAGPVGRVVTNLALLGSGTGVGLAILAGVAAIGGAFKLLTKDIDETNQRVTAAIQNVEKLSGALSQNAQARVAIVQGRSAAAELQGEGSFAVMKRELSAPELISGIYEKALLGLGGNQQEEVARVRAQVEASQALNAVRQEEARLMREQADALQTRLRTLTEAAIGTEHAQAALDRAHLGPHPTERQRARVEAEEESIARQADHERLQGMKDLTRQERDTIEAADAHTRALERQAAAYTRSLLPTEQELERRRDFPFQNVTYDPNDIYNDARARNNPNQPTVPGMSRGEQDAIDYRNRMLPGGGGGAEPAAVAGDKIGSAVARTLAANLPSLVGALSRGDAGGFLSSAGGAIEGLSNLKGLSAAGPIGLVASLVGGLVSLFSSGGAKMSILNIEERALTQLRTLTGTPNSVQVYLVDPATGNVRQTQFAINHAGRKDVVTRLPQP